MTIRSVFRATVAVAAFSAAASVLAQGASAPPSPSGARKGYPTAGAHEAAAARAANLESAGSESVHFRNALERCANLPGGYKEACHDRVRGAGTRTGSVEGGGILRESEVPADRLQPGPAYVPQQETRTEEHRVEHRHDRKYHNKQRSNRKHPRKHQ